MLTARLVAIEANQAPNLLASQEVRSLTSFFTVPKEEGDVRVVYNGTKSGLNGQLWAP